MITFAEEQEQHSLAWYRARLGNITGSKCGDLLVKGRAKDEVFGATAKSYLYQLAFERNLNPAVVEDDDLFSQYLETVDISSKQMRFGNENEDKARKLFERIYGVEVMEVASCKHETIEHFAASPDGVVLTDGRPTACVEIKCPGPTNFMKYCVEVTDNESLKKANSTYYWQIQAEMMCTEQDTTYFVVYNPFQTMPIHVVEITKNEDDCKLLETRIAEANKYIHGILTDNILNHE